MNKDKPINKAALFLSLISLICSFAVAQVTEDKGSDFATQTIQLALSTEPPQLNYMKTTDSVSFFVIEHVQEGLLRKDKRNQLAPGIAERWEMNGDTATFWLRKNAKWSDGEIITADDFVFSWRHVVDPNTASEYASIMFPVKNAEAITQGKMPIEELGITALDDFTLEVKLESPTGYFFNLMPFALYYPAREDFVNAQNGRFGADVDTMLYSGPFILSQWVHGASLRMEKNPNYWDKDSITLNAINIPYITPDSPARFNLYKDGKLAMEGGQTGLGSEQLKNALDSRYRIRSNSDGTVFFMEFNHRKERVTHNMNLRKAIQLIFDSQELVNKVIGIAGYVPGKSLIPVYLDGVNNKFRQEYKVQNVDLNLEQARHHLALAKQELQLESLPPLILLVDEGATSSLQAQYFQAHFKQTLGLEIRIDIQTFKQRLAKTHSGDFDLTLAGWGPDYEDPFTFTELFASWNVNNHGRYASDEFDALTRVVQNTADRKTRMDAMGKLQQLIIDDVVILPTYERKVSYVQNPNLQGVLFKVTGGSPIYTYSSVSEKQ